MFLQPMKLFKDTVFDYTIIHIVASTTCITTLTIFLYLQMCSARIIITGVIWCPNMEYVVTNSMASNAANLALKQNFKINGLHRILDTTKIVGVVYKCCHYCA